MDLDLEEFCRVKAYMTREKNLLGAFTMSANSFDFLKWLNLIALVAVIFVNILAASTTLIGGKVTAQITDENPTLITPAG